LLLLLDWFIGCVSVWIYFLFVVGLLSFDFCF